VLSSLLGVALALLIVASPESVQRLRGVVFDGYQRVVPLERTTAPAIVVAIDEVSLARFGQWPWPRTRMAQLIDAIAQYQPAAIGLDVFYPEADRFSPRNLLADLPGLSPEARMEIASRPSNDDVLARSMRRTRVVLGIAGSEFDPRFPHPPRNPPVVLRGDLALESYAGYLGDVDTIDAAGISHGLISSGQRGEVVRVVPMVARVNGVVVPSLGVETLRAAVDAGLRVTATGGGLARMDFDQVSSRIHDDGTAYLRVGYHDEDRFISAQDVIDGKPAPEALRSKVVLVGITGLGMLDFKTTPLGEQVPGVELHAQAVENLFNGVSLVRPDYAPWVEAAFLLVCAGAMILVVPRISAIASINVAILLVVLLAGAGFEIFNVRGLLFDAAWPAIGTVAVYLAVVVGTLSIAERQRRALREQAARMAGEVDAARRIQMGLLPDPQSARGDDARFEIAAVLEPARDVGGDFYDCFRLDDARVFFAVADVSGKGLPAALFMAAAKSHLQSAALAGGTVGEMLTHAQARMSRENPEQLFVTIFAAVLDPATGVLEHANAGHEPPLVRKPETAPERLAPPQGPPLCVVEDFQYETLRRTLQAGEWICVVTDGATEAMNAEREFFGHDRLRATLGWTGRDVRAEALVEGLREDVHRFAQGAEPADDLTLMVLRWHGASGR
jgi:serine phosphatase RsbU (regulator of sigma subunit)/CHASE2 domain-containing sensor protein